MSDPITAVLAAHQSVSFEGLSGGERRVWCECSTFFDARTKYEADADHRAHVAAMLAPVIREAKADAWDEGAETEADVHEGKIMRHNYPNPYRRTPK